MTDKQKTLFLFAFAALIATTGFNAAYFVAAHNDQLGAAIQMNARLSDRSPDQDVIIASRKIPTEVPTNVEATLKEGTDGTDSIIVTWEGTATGENGYSIYRKTATDSNFSFVKNVSADVTTFTDANILLNKTYTYKIKTWTSDLSKASNPVQVFPKEKSVNTVFGEVEL